MNILNTQQLKEFIIFLKKPVTNSKTNNGSQLRVFIFVLLINTLVYLCIAALDYLFHFIEKTWNLKEGILLLSEKTDIKIEKTIGLLIAICVIGPLIEEIAFRLPLLKKFAILLLISLGFFTISFYKESYFFSSFLITLVLFIGYLMYVFLIWQSQYKKNFLTYFLNTLYRKHYKYFFYCIIILFSLIHIPNYNWTNQNLIHGISILSISFITDLSFGYLMVRCGFIYSLSLHILWNTFAVLTELYL